MEGDELSPNTDFGSFLDSMELDLTEDLFFDGCWLAATDSAFPDSRDDHFGTNPHQKSPVEDTQLTNLEPFDPSTTLRQPQILVDVGVDRPDSGTSLWIVPKSSSGTSSSSMKERLFQALKFIQELIQDKDILVQIWVPVKKGDKSFLTTEKQPHSFNKNYESLERYRLASEGYNFPADEGVNESVGLPGRVFLAKLPEWTPDVRFFKREEYPRIKFAREYDVRGSLAIPVFERGSGTCQGVVEIVNTTQQINYGPELENICKALEAVDLQSSNNPSPEFKKFPRLRNEPYETELPQISTFLESVCRSNGLPLALTWASCVRQGKSGSRHSEQNYSFCVSTIDSACFAPDEDSHGFLVACSEHHLLQGEGIVGRAFKTNRRCFTTDVTAFSKTNYPLAHHAKVFGLLAGLAIPLRGIRTGSVELVLELFLPKDCIETEIQRQMLNSLTTAMHEGFKSSYLVMDEELEEEVILPVTETMVFCNGNQENQEPRSSETSWIAHMVEANRKGKGVSLSWEYQTEESKDELELVNYADNSLINADLGQFQKDSAPESSKPTVPAARETLGCRKSGEKRRTKMEKTVSLEVLRQYFAGSLKDAAKSLGVSPTTLKRICRQHGIARWPSRKIKKVDHSLKKLQLVIDTVEGVEGSIKLESFYTKFPDLDFPKFPEQSDQLQVSKTNSSSSCDHSSTGVLKKARSEAKLHAKIETEMLTRAQSRNRTFGENFDCEKGTNAIKVKVGFGEDNARFSLQDDWSFRQLQEKIAMYFKIDDISRFELKYLDDDQEWVMLICDDDLEECIDIYRSSQSHIIKISVQEASQTKI